MDSSSVNEICCGWIRGALARKPRAAFIALPSHLTPAAKATFWAALQRYRPELAALLKEPSVKEMQLQFGGVLEVPAADLKAILEGLTSEG